MSVHLLVFYLFHHLETIVIIIMLIIYNEIILHRWRLLCFKQNDSRFKFKVRFTFPSEKSEIKCKNYENKMSV